MSYTATLLPKCSLARRKESERRDLKELAKELLERQRGIEPPTYAYKGVALPIVLLARVWRV